MDITSSALAGLLNGGGVVSVIVVMGLLVITDKLVWHKRLKAAEARADRWEQIALTSLGVAEKLTVHAEVSNEVLTRLPDPALEERERL